jgi:hypothetical protein
MWSVSLPHNRAAAALARISCRINSSTVDGLALVDCSSSVAVVSSTACDGGPKRAKSRYPPVSSNCAR